MTRRIAHAASRSRCATGLVAAARRLALAVAAVCVATPADAQSDAARLTTLRVESVTADGLPLGYSLLQVPAQGLEAFTDGSGTGVLRVRPGRLLLRVRHLGFTPRDTTLEVAEGTSTTVRMALARVSFRLDAVRVVAWPPCKRPGMPNRRRDPQLHGIIEQVRENAERYRLLTRAYPFHYLSEREFRRRDPDGTTRTEGLDTIRVSGTPDWRYQPGRLVSRERGVASEWMMHIPVLSDLADEAFIDAHCFHVAGLEHKGEERLLRIDMVAAERLRSADVNVSVWLDPVGYQLRHASFTLTNTSQFPSLLHMISHVEYVEVVPFVPVMHRTTAENLVSTAQGGVVFTEVQEIVLLTFAGARP